MHFLKLRSFVEENQNKLDWCSISENPNAIRLLEQNPGKINWYCLSLNQNAIHQFSIAFVKC